VLLGVQGAERKQNHKIDKCQLLPGQLVNKTN